MAIRRGAPLRRAPTRGVEQTMNEGSPAIGARGQPLAPRRAPLQQRSLARAEQILRVTAELLEEVGFDALTTIR